MDARVGAEWGTVNLWTLLNFVREGFKRAPLKSSKLLELQTYKKSHR